MVRLVGVVSGGLFRGLCIFFGCYVMEGNYGGLVGLCGGIMVEG